ncbi:MAG: LysR family transcriptional regulator [Opitutaceae bacterium]|nr:LysR family transcriptional regulator [Opitutaceae bacterium]
MRDWFDVELRHLRYFVAVAAHGSFNRAAQVLHLTQPALSRQVKDLEAELGVLLLVRGKNTVSLTDAGERFYEEAREVLARADLAVQRVRGEQRRDVLRIGYAPSATAGILPRTLERSQAEHASVRVELVDVSPTEMIGLAKKGRLDAIVALEPSLTTTPGFQWSVLRRVNLVLVMRADDPLALLKRVPPRRLREVPLVGLARENFPDYVPHLRRILKPHGVAPRFVALESDGVSTLFATVEAHRAAAILADSVVGIMPRTLVCRPFSPNLDPVVAKIGISATYPKPYAAAFARLLREEAERATRRRA